jgi:5,5'-dehydrodivanillate O-demethylase oxygenase subunit
LGPLPAPLLPRWDVLVRSDGRRFGVIESVIDCNWLQAMENSVDPSHLYWLHGSLGSRNLPVGKERFAALGLRSEYDEKNEFFTVEYGIMKRRITPHPKPGNPPEMEQHPLVFPNILRLVPSLSSLRSLEAYKTLDEEESKLRYVHDMDFRTPIDDTHTMEYRLCFLPSKRTPSPEEDPPFESAPFKDERGNYRLEFIPAQDALAWEAQGPIADRTQEHLGVADRGIIMLRKLVREQIEAVERGEDPMGVIRDPKKNVLIDLDVVHEPLGLYRSTEMAPSSPAR